MSQRTCLCGPQLTTAAGPQWGVLFLCSQSSWQWPHPQTVWGQSCTPERQRCECRWWMPVGKETPVSDTFTSTNSVLHESPAFCRDVTMSAPNCLLRHIPAWCYCKMFGSLQYYCSSYYNYLLPIEHQNRLFNAIRKYKEQFNSINIQAGKINRLNPFKLLRKKTVGSLILKV